MLCNVCSTFEILHAVMYIWCDITRSVIIGMGLFCKGSFKGLDKDY